MRSYFVWNHYIIREQEDTWNSIRKLEMIYENEDFALSL